MDRVLGLLVALANITAKNYTSSRAVVSALHTSEPPRLAPTTTTFHVSPFDKDIADTLQGLHFTEYSSAQFSSRNLIPYESRCSLLPPWSLLSSTATAQRSQVKAFQETRHVRSNDSTGNNITDQQPLSCSRLLSKSSFKVALESQPFVSASSSGYQSTARNSAEPGDCDTPHHGQHETASKQLFIYRGKQCGSSLVSCTSDAKVQRRRRRVRDSPHSSGSSWLQLCDGLPGCGISSWLFAEKPPQNSVSK